MLFLPVCSHSGELELVSLARSLVSWTAMTRTLKQRLEQIWRKLKKDACNILQLKCYSAGLGRSIKHVRFIAWYFSDSLDHFECLQLQVMPAMQHIFLRSLCRGDKTCVATCKENRVTIVTLSCVRTESPSVQLHPLDLPLPGPIPWVSTFFPCWRQLSVRRGIAAIAVHTSWMCCEEYNEYSANTVRRLS